MNKQIYHITNEHTIDGLAECVRRFLAADCTLIGGPFSHAGMVCQAMMMTIHEEETEDENVH